jgi:signal transduction histidine kinase/ActR/RegA family two-component response regulator/HAMP domain-containing protein
MSFKFKTVLGVALIEALILALLVTLSLNFLYNSYSEAIQDQTRATAEQFSLTVKNALLSDDLASLESFVRSIVDSDVIVYSRILDSNGVVLAESGEIEALRREFHQDTSLESAVDDVFDQEVRIEVDGYYFGSVQIGYTTQEAYSIMREARNELILIALTEMVLVAIFSLGLGIYLTRQLDSLKKGADSIASGELGYTLSVVGNDELAETARSFNKMSTDLLEARQAATLQSQLFEDLVETSSDWFWETDNTGRLKRISKEFYHDHRIPMLEKDIIGKTWSEIVIAAHSEQTDVEDRLRDCVFKKEPFREIVYIRNLEGGETQWLSISGKLAYLETGEWIGYRGTGRDVTATVRRERELVKAKVMAEESVLAKSRFLANMSHELRTPLNGVLGITSLLAESNLDAEQEGYCDVITQSGEMLLRVLSDILDISKAEGGDFNIYAEPFVCHDLVGSVTHLFEGKATLGGNKLVSTVEPPEPLVLLGDAGRIKQILANLIGNATKFCSNGTISVAAVVSPSESTEDVGLHICVRDTGIGIPSEEIETIFDPFVQIDDSPTRQQGGTGLGLALVREFVSLMKGTYGVDSTFGEGATFWFDIPVKTLSPVANHESAPNHPVAKSPTFRADKATRILVAEDNHVNQLLMMALLKKQGYDVTLAPNGRIALDLVTQQNFDLVLMDLHMPELDGFAATRLIRAAQLPLVQSLPIIAVTANAMDGDREKCLQAGMNEYISKPVDRIELLSMIERFTSA